MGDHADHSPPSQAPHTIPFFHEVKTHNDYAETLSRTMAILEKACPDISKLFFLTGSGAAACFTLLPNQTRGLSHAVSLDIDLHSKIPHETINEVVAELKNNLSNFGVKMKNGMFDQEYGMLRAELHFPSKLLGDHQKKTHGHQPRHSRQL